MACSALKSWRRLVKKGRADPSKPPVFRALCMRLQKDPMRFYGDRIIITTRPREYIVIPLIINQYQRQLVEAWRKGELKAGEITLLEDKVIMPFKKEVQEREPKGYAAIDINLKSLDILKVKGGKPEYRRISEWDLQNEDSVLREATENSRIGKI